MQRLCLTYNLNFFIRYGRVVRARPFFNYGTVNGNNIQKRKTNQNLQNKKHNNHENNKGTIRSEGMEIHKNTIIVKLLKHKTMRKPNFNKAEMNVNADVYECLSIEREIEKAETTKQPIEATSPIIYTPRKDGVRPEYDIRTDRFEIAQDAMGKVAASYAARRADWIKSLEVQGTGTAEA